MIRRLISVAWLSAGLFALGCGGSSYDGRVYNNGDISFELGRVPSGYRRIDVENTLLAFRDDSGNSTIAFNARCGKDADDVPLQSLTHHLFLQFTDRQVDDQRKLRLDGRAAMRTEMVASLDGVAKRFVVYVLKKNGCVYDFLFIAPPGSDSALATFEQLVGSFHAVAP